MKSVNRRTRHMPIRPVGLLCPIGLPQTAAETPNSAASVSSRRVVLERRFI
jgi:hypothetical protein